MKRIQSITIQRLDDIYADHLLADLGVFSDTPGGYAIETKGGRGTYKYFNAENVDNMKDARKSYKRMMDYEKGVWSYIGVRADAVIETFQREDGPRRLHTITSGGIWGIETDSDERYIKESEEGEVEDLKRELFEFGFTEADFIGVDAKF